MARLRVLVMEDDPAIRQGIVDALQFEGYETLEAGNGNTGLDMAIQVQYDLLLLDLVLPGKDGLTILKELRTARPTLPVIVLTARGEESDRVRGLKLGADDYVVKPFSVKELLARVEAVLRRSPERPADIKEVRLAGSRIDLADCRIHFDDDSSCELSQREAELLRYLAINTGRVVSREEILSRVWRITPTGVETRTIDMHVARLREKLRDSGSEPRILLTVRGRGYMLAAGQVPP